LPTPGIDHERLCEIDIATSMPVSQAEPALANARPIANLEAGPSEKWCYDVIAFSQPWSDLFNEDVLAK